MTSAAAATEDSDLQIRVAAIQHCARLRQAWGEAVPASELTKGFVFQGQQVKLVSWGRGVFKPEQLHDGPLTLTSSLASTYADEHLDESCMLYDFAPAAFDWANRGLQRLAQARRPVILLKQVKEKPGSEYMLFAPVHVVSTDLKRRKFRLDLGAEPAIDPTEGPDATGIIEKRYTVNQVLVRVHQAHFRRNVLGAYRDRCCVCDLRERRLLDAAHITPDSDIHGEPIVANGLSMCPSHHRAFDCNFFSIHADYRILVNRGRLSSPESEATRDLLWRFHERQIGLPGNRRDYPDPDRLRERVRSA